MCLESPEKLFEFDGWEDVCTLNIMFYYKEATVKFISSNISLVFYLSTGHIKTLILVEKLFQDIY